MICEISHERLISLLDYDPITGVFTWTGKTCRRLSVGDVAGNTSQRGYRRIRIDGHSYQAHRLAHFYMTKKWPSQFIDHINGIKTDNSWKNLREADAEINQQNLRKARSTSSTGVLGVFPRNEKFTSKIRVNGKPIYLGTFANREEAHAAYLDAKRKLHEGCTI